MNGRALSLILALATAAACAPAAEKQPEAPPPLRITVADSGINTPESVLYDAAADVYLVSSINGSPLEKDNNGFISRVTPDSGRMATLKWIAGGENGVTLNAPKGMALKGDTLFVADLDVVRLFHRTTGTALGERAVRGATFLNDMTVGPDGTVYVTDSGLKPGPDMSFADSGTDALYKFDERGRAVAVTRGAAMGRPNGIAADSAGVVVVSFGSGDVYRIDASGTRTNLPRPPKGQLDGVEILADGTMLMSSWEGQAVYRFAGGQYTTAIDSVATPADIGYDPRRRAVLIPLMSANQVTIRELR